MITGVSVDTPVIRCRIVNFFASLERKRCGELLSEPHGIQELRSEYAQEC